jgi:N-acetylneuraminic acid mutarotase
VHFRLAGRLPQGLRYAAVAVAGGRLVIAGGIGARGPTADVFAFDPATGRVRHVGSLPVPLAHASAATLNGSVYIVGGIDASGRTLAGVSRVDVSRSTVDHVPGTAPVADAAVAQTPRAAYLIGGRANGRAVSGVRVLDVS